MFKKKESLHFATAQSIEAKRCKIKRDNKINKCSLFSTLREPSVNKKD